MNHHPAYPTRQELRRESIADGLIFAQTADVAVFLRALDVFKATVSGLEFPLGCPIVGYDKADVMAHLDDWTKIEEPSEDAAMDLAREVA